LFSITQACPCSSFIDIVGYLLKARTVKPAEAFQTCPLLGNRSVTCKNNRIVGMGCFLCGLCQVYIMRNSCDYRSLELAVRSVGGWCEMATSLGVRRLLWLSLWTVAVRSWYLRPGIILEPKGRATCTTGSC
jgi:hypothetical protein